MTKIKIAPTHIEQLRIQLKESLYLDLDDYGLAEQSTGEFNSTYLGVQLNSAFQPIYNVAAEELLFGYEALLRPSLGGELPSSPEFAFSYAEQSGKLVQFDRVCRTLHVLNFRQLYAENGLLFLNVHPKLLAHVDEHGRVFERILHANSVPTSRVVIEINESIIENEKILIDAVENYKDRGYRIAIDNFGKSHSNLSRLWKLSPDFVKLDISLVQGAEHNTKVKKVLPRIIDIIRDIEAEPVIKGIETREQFDIAIASYATLFQGYFLCRPVAAKDVHISGYFKSSTQAAA